MSRIITVVASIALWIAAAGLTAFAVHRITGQPPIAGSVEREVEDGAAIGATGRIIGSSDAPVRVVEFIDFQCPYCRDGAHRLRDIQRRFPGHLTIVLRHRPVPSLHPHAVEAALAMECAASQGSVEVFRDLLLDHQDSIGTTAWRDFGSRAGVSDIETFERCIHKQHFMGNVLRDAEESNRLGIVATPAYVLGNRLLFGVRSIDNIEEAVVAARDLSAGR